MAIIRFHCPFVGLSGCQDGCGNGLTKTSLIYHLLDRHFKGDALATTKLSLATSRAVFEATEITLKRMNLWLCGGCFKTHTLRSKCRHGTDVVSPLIVETVLSSLYYLISLNHNFPPRILLVLKTRAWKSIVVLTYIYLTHCFLK
jgi:hypothetical protein